MKKIILTESEKSRILGMHKSAIHSEKKIVNEATLKDIQAILIQRGFLPATSATGKPSDDNTLGPNTLSALKNALSPTAPQGTETPAGTQPTGTQGTGTQGTGTQGTGTQGTETPAGTNPTGTQPTGTPPETDRELKVGKIYEGTNQDNAEGKIFKVLSITPVKGCDVKEVQLQQTNGPKYIYFGYLQGTDVSPSDMMRSGDGGKSQNPCEELKKNQYGQISMMSFGHLENEGYMEWIKKN